MRQLILFAIFLTFVPAFGQEASRFDGAWATTVTCDAKGGALGYTFNFVSTVRGGVLHGERGTQGQPAYLAIDGKIGKGGTAKLTASGTTGSATYTHGPFKSEGEAYSYEVKTEFTETEGKGERSTGLGIVGRPCHWRFEKQTGEGNKP